MKIYLVERTDTISYDEFDSWVVEANSPEDAIAMCDWGDGSPSLGEIEVEEIKPKGFARKILGSFNAG